ncbi:MAG: ABC-type transport auxiliary lipoprotein family protein [Gammaproteobacteria bacterium]
MNLCKRAVVMVGVLSLAGCALLPTGSKKKAEKTYLIAPVLDIGATGERGRCGVIQVGVGPAVAGQRGANMTYTLDSYELSYFAFARWGDAPSRMLQDQMRVALGASGAFSGVLSAPVSAQTDYQLELADVSVVQRFADEASSALAMAFEVRLYDGDRRHLLAAQGLETRVAAGGDAPSGVAAANAAASDLLAQATEFVLARCGLSEL